MLHGRGSYRSESGLTVGTCEGDSDGDGKARRLSTVHHCSVGLGLGVHVAAMWRVKLEGTPCQGILREQRSVPCHRIASHHRRFRDLVSIRVQITDSTLLEPGFILTPR
ncbi:hypothetical protein M404DRAFT_877640 [Pisolithus tinctorius Marx 270]|uniref:Uncharacterized protein n=1 Tax=Pisolithus tinctorius Marx 270 TaxID=870435 RepID=A0A0C3PPI8_PISTI|nr:hypothetical protein M404DRAFT_877640 [Pisolithus tinctorius Marx 270]